MKGGTTLMALGVILVVAGGVVTAGYTPLATVLYPQYFWHHLVPGGTQSQPSLLTAGQDMVVSASLVYYDATADVELPSPAYWTVTVSITDLGSYSKTITFSRGSYQSVKIEDHYCAVAIYEATWSVPSGEGLLYTFSWLVKVKDRSGNLIDTADTKTYGKTAAEEPDGYFTINGEKASETATIITLDGKLDIDFIGTKNPSKITNVYVKISKGGSPVKDLTLSKRTESKWSNVYDLPERGTFEVKGYFEYPGSSTPILKMNILANFGEEPPPEPEPSPFPWLPDWPKAKLLGVGSMTLGVIFIVAGAVMNKKE